MTESEFKDLTGDPVYDFLKSKVLPGHTLAGGIISDKKIAGPKEPRKTIEILIKTKSGKTRSYTYNYKKLERKL